MIARNPSVHDLPNDPSAAIPRAFTSIDGASTTSGEASLDKGKAPQRTNTTYSAAFDGVSNDGAEYGDSDKGEESVCPNVRYRDGCGEVECMQCKGQNMEGPLEL
jgi:hypothetical protein